MRLTQHGRDLWQLTRLHAFNNYLVQEKDGLTVIDTNLGRTAVDILTAAEQIGQPIRRILLTHAHGDHVASLDDLYSQLQATGQEIEVGCSERTARFLAGDMSLLPHEPASKLRGGYQTCDTKPTHLLSEGELVGSLRVIFAPGHTPGHIAFYDERHGHLLAGDAWQTQGGLAVAGMMRWLFPFPAMATWHLPTAVASAKKLYDLQPKRLAVGHGRVLENPAAAMAQAITQAERKLDG